MELIAWFIVAFLSGAVFGLAFPRLCPRCHMEQVWVKKTLREFKKLDGNKHSKSA